MFGPVWPSNRRFKSSREHLEKNSKNQNNVKCLQIVETTPAEDEIVHPIARRVNVY